MGIKKTRRKFTASFKSKVVLEVIKEQESLASISSKYEVHINQINKWKREFLSNVDKAFSNAKEVKRDKEIEAERDHLHRKVRELKKDNDFLKESLQKVGLSTK